MIRKVLLAIAMSPYTQIARLATAVLSCLFILDVIEMTPIDSAAFAFPEEFLPVMLVAALGAGIFAARATRFKLHDIAETNKHENGKLDKKKTLPYDRNYEFGTFFGFVAGTVLGMVLATILVPQIFVNAGTWTYALMTILCTVVAVAITTVAFHFGVRWTITTLAEKAKETTEALKDAKNDIDEAVDNINDLGKDRQ